MPEADDAGRAAPITYLIGPPGVGKLTVARVLAARTGAKIIDNHTINNPIFALLDLDGGAPIPPEAWRHVAEVGRAVYETMTTLSPKSWRFVLTNYLADHPDEAAHFARIVDYADRRGSPLLPVRLHCDPWALRLRVANPSRHTRKKATDPDTVLALVEKNGLLTPDHPHLLDLDTTEMSAERAAGKILLWEREKIGNRKKDK